MSTTELARRLGWSQAKVSRVERGVTLAKSAEVDRWARILHAPAEERRTLVALAERESAELRRWKQEFAPGRRRVQEEVGRLEAQASVIWICPLEIIPGLAQTPEYATAMFQIGRDSKLPGAEVTEAVTARIARQKILEDRAKRFKLLFTESALRRSLLPRDSMRDQLSQLARVAQLPNVEVGAIPFKARERTHTYHGFTILGDPDVDESALVLAETVTRALRIRDPDEVREYIAHYERLAEGAVFGDELLTLLQEISAEAPWS